MIGQTNAVNSGLIQIYNTLKNAGITPAGKDIDSIVASINELQKSRTITISGRIGYSDGDGTYGYGTMKLTYNPKTKKCSLQSYPSASTNVGTVWFCHPSYGVSINVS